MSRIVKLVNEAATPILVACALLMTGIVIKNQFFAPTPTIPEPTVKISGRPAPRHSAQSAGQLIGTSTSPVRIIEFADFQCPFCAKAATTMEKLIAEQPGRFAVEFHHSPIASHPFARGAAEASECAAEQGRFSAFYFVLYSHQSQLGHWSWTRFAQEAGVQNLAGFDSCVASGRSGAKVDRDQALSDALGVRGTPTWLIGDTIYGGLPPTSQIREWIGAR